MQMRTSVSCVLSHPIAISSCVEIGVGLDEGIFDSRRTNIERLPRVEIVGRDFDYRAGFAQTGAS